MIAEDLDFANLKVVELKVDFSNVKVESVGGLPTFSYDIKNKAQYCDCCGVEMTIQKAIEYLGKLPIPRLMSNTFEDCIEQNKYCLAIKMGIEALAKSAEGDKQ